VREHEGEPLPGLPEQLPAGERILWQGSPAWRPLARHGFHLRLLALYFAALAALRAGSLVADGAPALEVTGETLWILLLGAVPVGLFALFSRLVARSTLYTITDRRTVLRVGVALPMTINIPHAAVRAADLRLHPGGGGDIVLTMEPPHRVSYVALWPHLRGLRLADPRPMLRAIPDAQAAAETLSRALAASVPGTAQQRVTLTPASHPAQAGMGAAATA
jgi:hypothetical protein